MKIELTFIEPSGAEKTIEATDDVSIMRAAYTGGIDGITAECNGSAACATCHVIFEETLLACLPEMSEHENDLLDFAASERQTGSRLSCQIPVTKELDGAKITVPETQ